MTTKNDKNPDAESFLKNAERFGKEMAKLREIALSTGLDEEIKWNKPVYSLGGKNVAIIQEFKESCTLMFTKGVLLKDPKKLLVKPGEHSQATRYFKFTSLEEVKAQEKTLKAFLKEAIALEKAGAEVNYKESKNFELPAELTAKLEKDPALKAAFKALTPGRQRFYAIFISSAKQTETRVARVDKCIPKIRAGKGLND